MPSWFQWCLGAEVCVVPRPLPTPRSGKPAARTRGSSYMTLRTPAALSLGGYLERGAPAARVGGGTGTEGEI